MRVLLTVFFLAAPIIGAVVAWFVWGRKARHDA